MQRLALMTLGAAFIGVCGFAYDTSAQVEQARPAFESVVYFPEGSNELNAYSDFAIDSVAKTVRTEGAGNLIMQTQAAGERAEPVATAVSSDGIDAAVAPLPTPAIRGDI